MKLLCCSLFGLTLLGQYHRADPPFNAEKLGKATPDEVRLLGKALYKCGQITADIEWATVISDTGSKVNFTIEPGKSVRAWDTNKCEDVLSIFGIPK